MKFVFVTDGVYVRLNKIVAACIVRDELSINKMSQSVNLSILTKAKEIVIPNSPRKHAEEFLQSLWSEI